MLVIGIAILSISSCAEEPTACFMMDRTTAQVNTPITCTATCSVEAEKYIWMGSDGATLSVGGTESVTQQYTFNAPGTYTITLKVQNGRKTNETSKNVVITE